MNPKLSKCMETLGLLSDSDASAVSTVTQYINIYLIACRFEGADDAYVKVKHSQLTRSLMRRAFVG